jgi:hypothetical protein
MISLRACISTSCIAGLERAKISLERVLGWGQRFILVEIDVCQ